MTAASDIIAFWREIAEKATRGPWVKTTDEHQYEDGSAHRAWGIDSTVATYKLHPREKKTYPVAVVEISYDRDYQFPEGACQREADAEHIATFDPPTVLKLLAVVEAARLAACLPRTQRKSSVLAALDAALAALTEEGE